MWVLQLKHFMKVLSQSYEHSPDDGLNETSCRETDLYENVNS
jgi:hypothetical protein